jgi:hypothetical protein
VVGFCEHDNEPLVYLLNSTTSHMYDLIQCIAMHWNEILLSIYIYFQPSCFSVIK